MISKSGKIQINSELPPVLVLFGDEEFLQEEYLKSMITAKIKTEEDRFNFDQFDGEIHDADTIADACNAFPMMSDKRIVVVKRFEKLFVGRQSKKKKNKLLSYIHNPVDSTKLIISLNTDKTAGIGKSWQKSKNSGEKKIKSLKYPFDEIILNHEWIEFEKIYPNHLSSWISKRIKEKYNKSIEHEAAELLVIQKNNDLRELDSEIEKIIQYAKSKDKISTKDVSEVIGISKQYNVFELQDAMGAKDLKKSLIITDKILSTSREEVLIITLLANFFISLWKLKESNPNDDKYSLASQLKINPFFVDKYKLASNKYSNLEIENAILKLREADYKLKSSQTNSKLLIQKLLIEIIS